MSDSITIDAAIGCVIALAMWKATSQRWGFSLAGVLVLALTLKYGNTLPFPFNAFVWFAGVVVLSLGKPFIDYLDRRKSEKDPQKPTGGTGYTDWLKEKLAAAERTGDTKKASEVRSALETLGDEKKVTE